MRTRDQNLAFLFSSALLAGFLGCSSSSDNNRGTGTGGSSESETASGSAGNSGGVSSSSGSSAGASSAGDKSSGGASSSSSNPGSGGVSAGGDKSSGGTSSTGKSTGTGTGGTRPEGGTTATGGKGGGGAATGGTAGGHTGTSGGTTGSAGAGGTTGSTGTGGGSTGSTLGGEPVKSDGCGKTSSLKTGLGLTITLKSPGSGDRNYNLKLPDNYDNTHPYRLIMSYHWIGGTAKDVTNGTVAKPYYGLVDLAKNSAIFVAPDGTPNTMMGSGGNMWANSNGSDVEFSRQLIEMLESELCIDKSRIFCEGFSMGGSMSYAMACGLGDMVRAVAIHSGGSMSGCAKHDKPVAAFMTHGTSDGTCKWPSFPIPLIQDFGKINGCTEPDPKLAQDPLVAALPKPTDSSGKTPECVDFKGCKPGYPFRVCLFVGDHTPSPGGTSGWVPKQSWDFLSQF